MTDAAFTDNVLQAIAVALSGRKPPVALHEPCLAGNEWKYVKECLDTGWVSSVGSYVDRFETDLASRMGVARAVAVVSGTAALHTALLLAGVEPGDEVLVPALTFVATANAVSYCGAIPHFVDVDEVTLGVSAQRLEAYLGRVTERRGLQLHNRETSRPIRALLAMHTFGHPCDLQALSTVCENHGLVLIEDAAEALGSYYKGRSVGAWGRLSALSFNGNKIATAGGGGAVLTNDQQLADRAKHLTTTARLPHQWEFVHDAVGFNYRLPNINAALGCAQLEQLDDFVEQKRALAESYRVVFRNVEDVRFFVEPENCRSNYWLNAILLDPRRASLRDAVLEKTNASGYMTRPAWRLMHRLPMYQGCPRMALVTSETLAQRLINIPSSAFLGRSNGQE